MKQKSPLNKRVEYLIALTAIVIASTMLLRVDASASELPGLVSQWSAEGNANDSVGSNNGTLVNGATFAPGVVEQGFSFNGASYVEVPDSSDWAFGDLLFRAVPTLGAKVRSTWLQPSVSNPAMPVAGCLPVVPKLPGWRLCASS